MFGLKNNKFDLWRGWIPIASCQLGLLIMFLLSLNCFFYVIKNSVIVNSLIAKCTSTINKAFFFFFFFFFYITLYRYILKGTKNMGKLKLSQPLQMGVMRKIYLDLTSIFSFPTEYQREEITSVLIKMSWILLTLLFMSLPYKCFAVGDNNTGGPSCNDNVSE